MFDENAQNNTQQTDAQDTQITGDQNQNLPLISPDPVVSNNSDDNLPVTDPYTPAVVQPAKTEVDNGFTQDDDLISIKKKALQQLAPLVNQLDQEPDEKFKTMLMMIQASDDKTMLNDAYETAQKISDEKIRAQALLDIVNEINYFTHQTKSE